MRLLKKGDTIGLVATARFIEPGELFPFVKWLESKELKVKLARNIFVKFHQFAGDDEFRASCFQELLEDEGVEALWIVRGGYGTTRILDFLDWSKYIQNPKWIIGFSDITLLHLQLAALGIISIHGDMPLRFQKVPLQNFDSVLNILFHGELHYTIESTSANDYESNGKIIGGNLSLLVHSLGNITVPWDKNTLLFLEDLEEYVYHIDRMAYQLKHNGILNSIKGLLLGSFTDLKDNEIPFGWSVEEIFQRMVDKPLIHNLPFGHAYQNLAFIHNYAIQVHQKRNIIQITQSLKL